MSTTSPVDLEAVEEQLELEIQRYQDARSKLTWLSLVAICGHVRRRLPDAAQVALYWSDQGVGTVPDGVYGADGEPIVDHDGAELDNAIESYCSNLTEDSVDSWLPFTKDPDARGATVRGEIEIRLKIDAVLAAHAERIPQEGTD